MADIRIKPWIDKNYGDWMQCGHISFGVNSYGWFFIELDGIAEIRFGPEDALSMSKNVQNKIAEAIGEKGYQARTEGDLGSGEGKEREKS